MQSMPTPPAALAAPLAFALAFVGGCSKPAAKAELSRQPEEPVLTGTMTSAQQREIESAFESLAKGMNAANRPVIAPSAGRWSDVYPAVVAACDEIEAAIVRKTIHEWGWEIHLRTVEEWPGTLTIRRVAPEPELPPASDHATSPEFGPRAIYEATATIGLYGDRTERAEALLAGFDKHLRAFGRKRRLPDDDSNSH